MTILERVVLAGTIACACVAGEGTDVFVESGGVIEIEAEEFARKSVSTFERYEHPHEWRLKTERAGFSGTGYMEVVPDERDEGGNGPNSPRDNSGAEMVYRIRVTRGGIYNVWVRGLSLGGESNGVHVGVDGRLAGKEVGASNMSGFRPHEEWRWENRRKHGYEGTAVLELTPGEHMLHVWSRDDGFRMDRLVLKIGEGAPEE